MTHYIFDVDGTLTPSRGQIDPEFKKEFKEWIKGKDVYLLTGSDAPKTKEQIGEDIWEQLVCYQCCGNEIYVHGKKIYQLSFPPENIKDKLHKFLENRVSFSRYPEKTSNHIEYRLGMINFSVIGRDCTQEQREAYFKWDKEFQERSKVANLIASQFPSVETSVGGQISIDIYPVGKNKGQVYDYLQSTGHPIYFFGDRTEKGGNDFPLAERLSDDPHKVFHVKGPSDTMKLLKTLS